MQGIKMHGIGKCFGNKWALKDVNLEVKAGTIHAIVGENGAGKSTLMNILSGVLQPTEGFVEVDGKKARMHNPQDAVTCGIGMVYQHFMLVQSLKVWQNVVLGIEPVNKCGKIRKQAALEMIHKACSDYGMQIDPEQLTGELTIGEQQRVEILKVMVRNARYIIFDEPTAVLTPQETDRLLESLCQLRDRGKTIIFISHKLEEVLRVADEITVLRLGNKVGSVLAEEATSDMLVNMMVGRKVSISGYPMQTQKGNTVLDIQDIRTLRSNFHAGLQGISLDVREGEVLGIAGVDGNGQSELVNAILGFEPVVAGEIRLQGKCISSLRGNTAAIRKSGISLIPPDRQTQGLVMDSTIVKNTVLGIEDNPQISVHHIIRKEKSEEIVTELMTNYDVRLPSVNANASELSGGNQQKVILAREFGLRQSKLVLAVNPTRGLDIGAIEFVYAEMERQKNNGKAILLISTELSEIMRLSDRIAVLFHGKCMGVIDRSEATIDQLGRLMMGILPEEANANAAK